jgi:hypothetical protein
VKNPAAAAEADASAPAPYNLNLRKIPGENFGILQSRRGYVHFLSFYCRAAGLEGCPIFRLQVEEKACRKVIMRGRK